jgi:hypothetical protein
MGEIQVLWDGPIRNPKKVSCDGVEIKHLVAYIPRL